jgi:hypothetical protein
MTLLSFQKDFSPEQTEQLHSYAETLAFITADIYGTPSKLAAFYALHPLEEFGLVEHLNVIIAWAKQFEQENEGREWDGEWSELIESFLTLKLRP